MDKVGKAPVLVLAIGFWGSLIVLGLATFITFPEHWYFGMIGFWVLHIATCLISWLISGLSLMDWHHTVGMSGVRKLSKTMTRLSRSTDDPNTRQCWESVFDLWWGISIKYVCPFALWFLLSSSIATDMKESYGKYHGSWQILGLCFPVVGLLIFIYSLAFCTKKDPFNPEVDKAFEDVDQVEEAN